MGSTARLRGAAASKQRHLRQCSQHRRYQPDDQHREYYDPKRATCCATGGPAHARAQRSTASASPNWRHSGGDRPVPAAVRRPRASLIQGPRGVAPTAPGQVLPGAGPTPTVPGQPRPGPNALGKPVPQSTLQPAAGGKPLTGSALPGPGGQRMPTSIPAAPAQGDQAQLQRGRNTKPGRGQPLSSSVSAVPRQSTSPGAQPLAPNAPRSTQPSPPASGAIAARKNNNLAVRPPPRQRPSQPAAPTPQATAHPPKPPPQAARPPAPTPQAMHPPKQPLQAARPPGPAPQAMHPPASAKAARPGAPACPPGTHFANGKCVK